MDDQAGPSSRAMERTMDIIERNVLSPEGSNFEYGELEPGQFRLLLLSPGVDSSSPIECMMMISDFETLSLSEYTALSYTWGDPEPPAFVSVNQHRVKVTKNLEDALRRIRRSDGFVSVVWVDAICINQQNDGEKGHQVQLMRHIYGRAKTVDIWLGNHDAASEAVMITLQGIELGVITETAMFNMCVSSEESPLHEGFETFFKRNYWNRAWIVQELVCSKDAVVHCGDMSINWLTIVKFNGWLSKWNSAVTWPVVHPELELQLRQCPHILAISVFQLARNQAIQRGRQELAEDSNTFFGVLTSSTGRRATDARDMVYAILGIVEDIDQCGPFFPIDYSISVEQVYMDAAMHIIVLRSDLNILMEIRREQKARSKFDLPSWCPDWSLEHDENPMMMLQGKYTSRIMPADAGVDRSLRNFEIKDRELKVYGTVVDKISALCPEFTWEHIFWYQWLSIQRGTLGLEDYYSPEERKLIEKWTEISVLGHPDFEARLPGTNLAISTPMVQRSVVSTLSKQVPKIVEEETLLSRCKDVADTLIMAELDAIGEPEEDFLPMYLCYMGWQEPPKYEGLSATEAMLRFTKPWRRLASSASGRRRFLLSEGEHLGLAPSGAKEGDLICVLYGCVFPVLLRQHRECFEVIGVMYLQGFMHGEAVRKLKDGELESREFRLL